MGGTEHLMHGISVSEEGEAYNGRLGFVLPYCGKIYTT